MSTTTSYAEFVKKLKGLCRKLLPLYVGTAHGKVGTKIQTKEDTPPVVDLDNYSLARFRALIARCFPEDYTIGEEDRKSPEEMAKLLAVRDRHQWTIDGLDGTWHFIRGTNSYGAMISRRLGDNIVFSMIFRPIDMALRGNGFFYAERGGGAWEWCSEHRKYHRLKAAAHGSLERTTVLLEGSSKKFFEEPVSLLGKKITTRPSLSSCIAATTVARGDASAVVTVGHKPWDAWPIALFVQEAGGVVTDHRGDPFSPEDSGNVIAAASNEDHREILMLLNPRNESLVDRHMTP